MSKRVEKSRLGNCNFIVLLLEYVLQLEDTNCNTYFLGGNFHEKRF